MVQLFVVAPDEARGSRIADAVKTSSPEVDVVELDDASTATETIGAGGRDQDVLLLADVPDEATLDELLTFKADDATRRIPVICLIQDRDPQMVARAYDNYINACVNVPHDDEQLEKAVRDTVDFFVGKVRLAGATTSGR